VCLIVTRVVCDLMCVEAGDLGVNSSASSTEQSSGRFRNSTLSSTSAGTDLGTAPVVQRRRTTGIDVGLDTTRSDRRRTLGMTHLRRLTDAPDDEQMQVDAVCDLVEYIDHKNLRRLLLLRDAYRRCASQRCVLILAVLRDVPVF
jgi:hypothetical protein